MFFCIIVSWFVCLGSFNSKRKNVGEDIGLLEERKIGWKEAFR